MKAHKHAELIKAWAEGAEIEFKDGIWLMASSPTWRIEREYRIDPNCEYAIEKIRELGGDEAVELYKDWLSGDKLEFFLSDEGFYHAFSADDVSDPFKMFNSAILDGGEYRRDKQTVKQVLWVYYREDDPNMENSFLWFPENYPFVPDGWHKVPTCTREVEL